MLLKKAQWQVHSITIQHNPLKSDSKYQDTLLLFPQALSTSPSMDLIPQIQLQLSLRAANRAPAWQKVEGLGKGADILPAPLSRLCRVPVFAPEVSSLPIPLAGLGTFMLPRMMGPNTVQTAASPCDSTKWKSQWDHYNADLTKVSSAFLQHQLKLFCSPHGRRAAKPAGSFLSTPFAATGAKPESARALWKDHRLLPLQQERGVSASTAIPCFLSYSFADAALISSRGNLHPSLE